MVTIKKDLKYHGGLVLFGQIQQDALVRARKERRMMIFKEPFLIDVVICERDPVMKTSEHHG